MKKRAILEIDIDLEQEGVTGCRFNDRERFLITIRRDMVECHSNLNKEGVVAALSHELGHMLAVMFNMPGLRQDFRLNSEIFKQEIPADPADGVIACETEAWDLAFLMLESARVKTEAMKSYTGKEEKDDMRKEYAMRRLTAQLKSLLEGTF
jgi:hypothetical protein